MLELKFFLLLSILECPSRPLSEEEGCEQVLFIWKLG